MDLHKAELLAKTLMREHELFNPTDGGFPWAFSFNRKKNRAGECNYTNRTILLSKVLTEIHSDERVHLTILHEVAHAIVGFGHGHDEVWVAKCLEIGGDGQEKFNTVTEGGVTPAWQSRCSTCGNSGTAQHRAPLRVKACGKCSPAKFDVNYMLSWYHFGQEAFIYDMPERFRSEFNLLADRYEFQSYENLTGRNPAVVDNPDLVDGEHQELEEDLCDGGFQVVVDPSDVFPELKDLPVSTPVATAISAPVNLIKQVRVSLVKPEKVTVEAPVTPVKPAAKPRASRAKRVLTGATV